MLFLANFDPPLPCHTLSHIPGPPESTSHISEPPSPIFSRPSTKTRTKAPCITSLSIVRGGFCPGGFVWGGLCPFPLLSEYVLQQKVKHHFKFHISYYCMIKMYKCDVTCSLSPS